jgi:hypothetical protein
MAFKGKIASVTIDHSIADNADYLKIGLEIYEDNKLIETRYLGFPLGTKEAEIKEEIKKYLDAYVKDQELKVQSQKVESLMSQAHEVLQKLQGKEIK